MGFRFGDPHLRFEISEDPALQACLQSPTSSTLTVLKRTLQGGLGLLGFRVYGFRALGFRVYRFRAPPQATGCQLRSNSPEPRYLKDHMLLFRV